MPSSALRSNTCRTPGKRHPPSVQISFGRYAPGHMSPLRPLSVLKIPFRVFSSIRHLLFLCRIGVGTIQAVPEN